MSAVQGFGRRAGPSRLLSALAEFIAAPRVDAAAPAARKVVVGAPDRVQSLIERQLRSLPPGATVIELVYAGAGHAAWVQGPLRYRAIDIAEDGNRDATLAALRKLEDDSVHMVFSINAIERIRTPWRVADEIERVLRPKGVTLHSSRFSTRYDSVPEDYCRFTPDGLKALFADFDCVFAEFEATDEARALRRRGEVDLFGGSREGWLTHFCGRKRG
ncbi:methyltransferase domain-containing protein [Oryzibacter oryziterrae]|uniref:methyltransferase domain-containing protein n=1 Tax=Oryzibacter oryziterrae TaxID=2766474 RepID=UPI001F014056|nr:methyltransferase domain-containing protein [Oryzibacter oryziterrae]